MSLKRSDAQPPAVDVLARLDSVSVALNDLARENARLQEEVAALRAAQHQEDVADRPPWHPQPARRGASRRTFLRSGALVAAAGGLASGLIQQPEAVAAPADSVRAQRVAPPHVVQAGVYPRPGEVIRHHLLHVEDPTEVIESALRRGYTFVWVSELLAAMQGHGTLPSKWCLLSFDDVRAPFFTTAHPVVRRFGIRANIFVCSNYQYAAARGLATAADYPVSPSLSRYGIGVGWPNLRKCQATGLYEFHNHTATHTNQGTLPTAQSVLEFETCNAAIERELGVTPLAVAYPNGGYSGQTFAALHLAGISLAFDFAAGGKAGTNRWSLMSDHPYTLNRSLGIADGRWLDNSLEDVLISWGTLIPGEINALDRYGFWTAAGNAFLPRGESWEALIVNNHDYRPVAGSWSTRDYFRVRPDETLYSRFYTQSEMTSQGAGYVQMLQYDDKKTLLTTTELAGPFTRTTLYARYDLYTRLQPSCAFVRFQMSVSAGYNGILHVKDLIVQRAWTS